MYLFHIFRSFLPLHNPIGFGAADFIEFAIAGLLFILLIAKSTIKKFVEQVISKPLTWALVFAAAPVVLRLALLMQAPAPLPSGADDFSYLLLSSTLLHVRLANPTHPLCQFFETNFVLQQPTYSSIFPLGQGIALALGSAFTGHPWAGVLLPVGALCGLCYWMLRGWTTPAWALVGGLLAMIQFGPLNQWTNSYWGGAVSAAAGCLVFGSLPRTLTSDKKRYPLLVGAGLALQILTRPFESVLLACSVLLFYLPLLRSRKWQELQKIGVFLTLAVLPAVGLTLLQNKAVTKSWTTLPYMLARYQYGVPATFTFQPNATPHRKLTSEQELDYRAQAAVHGDSVDTIGSYFERLFYRVRYYRFFLLAPLYLVIPFFLLRVREPRYAFVLAVVVLFALGTNVYPYFYPHYVAAILCLLVLMSVAGLERLAQIEVRGYAVGREISGIVVLVCAAHFLFWYGLRLSGFKEVAPALSYEVWDYVNPADAEGRATVDKQLAAVAGEQLVFVRYWPQHQFHEWIHNSAAIDRQRVVWALDLGNEENAKLLRYYPARKPWLLEPDARPPKLTPYNNSQSILENVQ